jgi:hypothetical protein
VDVTDVILDQHQILDQHHEQPRMFAVLDEVPRDDAEASAAVWGRLEVLLEVHAEAEETLLLPAPPVGRRGDRRRHVREEVEDAVKDHDEIRDAIRATRAHEVGSDDWWAAVGAARKANDDHMGEEERQDLLDSRRHADLQIRHDIAVQFLTFEAATTQACRPGTRTRTGSSTPAAESPPGCPSCHHSTPHDRGRGHRGPRPTIRRPRGGRSSACHRRGGLGPDGGRRRGSRASTGAVRLASSPWTLLRRGIPDPPEAVSPARPSSVTHPTGRSRPGD